MPKITAAQLLDMSAEQLRGHRMYELEDDLTDEDFAILRQKLQDHDLVTPLDADLLSQKLANINNSPLASPPASPHTPVWNLEEARPWLEAREYTSYDELIADGGIPTHHPSTTNEHIWAVPNKGVIQFWRTEHDDDDCNYTLYLQAEGWARFRQHQDEYRNEESISFAEYESIVKRRRTQWGLKGPLSLKRKRQEQTQLEDFKEWQLVEHNVLNFYKEAIEHAAKKNVGVWDELERARYEEGNAYCSYNRRSLLTGWIDEQVARLEAGQASVPTPKGSTNPSTTSDRTLRKRKFLETEQTEDAHTSGQSEQKLKRCKDVSTTEKQSRPLDVNSAPVQRASRQRRTSLASATVIAQETTATASAMVTAKQRHKFTDTMAPTTTQSPRRSERIANRPQVKYPK